MTIQIVVGALVAAAFFGALIGIIYPDAPYAVSFVIGSIICLVARKFSRRKS